MLSDRILIESIRRIQWGESGAYIVVMFNSNIQRMLPVGSRFDIEAVIQVPLSGRQNIRIDISGVWTVFETAIHSTSKSFTMTLFKGYQDLANFGDGSFSYMKEVARMYPDYHVFSQSENNYYFTWRKSIRKYRTITQIAKKIKRFSLPIFNLAGGIDLVNPNDFPIQYEQYTLIHGNNVYPYKREAKFISGIDYEMEVSTGKIFELEGAYLEPGKVYVLNVDDNFGTGQTNEIRYICRDVALESIGDGYKPLSVVSVYEERKIVDYNKEFSTYTTTNRYKRYN